MNKFNEAKVLLEVRDLKTYFKTDNGILKAVDGVSFTVHEGETVGLVGESGCGKSVTNLSIMRLVPSPPGKIVGGEVVYRGTDIMKLSEKELRNIRGNKISMIFQDPMTSLNPYLRISTQMIETIRLHQDMTKQEARERAIHMLKLVGIADPEGVYKKYPHELSGGMRQRVMIAIALLCNPKLIIADEPTTALDVTIQAQILDLLREIKGKINGSIMLITHDLGVVAEMADYVVVMYAGKVIEMGTAEDIFDRPLHPYTIGLQKSKPTVNEDVEKLYCIPGFVPNPIDMPNYCYFRDRCEKCIEKCAGEYPGYIQVTPTHKVACYLYENAKEDGDAK